MDRAGRDKVVAVLGTAAHGSPTDANERQAGHKSLCCKLRDERRDKQGAGKDPTHLHRSCHLDLIAVQYRLILLRLKAKVQERDRLAQLRTCLCRPALLLLLRATDNVACRRHVLLTSSRKHRRFLLLLGLCVLCWAMLCLLSLLVGCILEHHQETGGGMRQLSMLLAVAPAPLRARLVQRLQAPTPTNQYFQEA
jgi:hypothetical protein